MKQVMKYQSVVTEEDEVGKGNYPYRAGEISSSHAL